MTRSAAPADVAIVINRLSENWLGGLNYFRNLVSVFDDAGDVGLRLHVLTDDPAFLGDMKLSHRVQVHRLPMLRNRSTTWVLRKALLTTLKRDVLLIAHLKRLGVRAVVFCHVAGAVAAGIRCLPWIPDFQSSHHPELFDSGMVEAENRRTQEWLRDSDGLIVSSQAARDDAVTYFGASLQRLHVLHFAPRFDFAAYTGPAERDAVFARHGIDRPYFFLPNQYWQHKNHALVIEALRLLQDSGAALPLVVSTGKTVDLRDPAYFGRFQATVQAAGLSADYRVLGVIARHDMLVLLAHSMAVLNPSRFEGWSTSVEEAKAFGKPVLASDIAVHREQVAGLPDAALFDTEDAPALAALLLARQSAARGLQGHPPLPDGERYAVFSRQFIALLNSLLVRPGVPA